MKFRFFPKITSFSKNHNSAADFLTMFLYSSKVADFCPLKHIKKSRKSKNTYFGKLSFSEKKVDKKNLQFFSVFLFFLKSPQQYLQLCRRHQIDQKIHSKVTAVWIFTYHFCMDSSQNCMETCMGEPMTQNSIFSHREGPHKVWAKSKNTNKIHFRFW